MKIDLPLETWIDVFAFMPRHKLVQLVPVQKRKHKRAGRKCRPIWNRQFVSFVQFYLHKCGHVELGNLEIKYPTNGNDAVVFKVYRPNQQFSRALPLADVPMPENIKNFKEIYIHCFGQPVVRFLQHFERHSLFTDVILHLHDSDVMLSFMTTVMPLIASFDHIFDNHDILALMLDKYSTMAMPMLQSARVLTIRYNLRDGWLCEWLCTPREDGKPRVLFLDYNWRGDCLPIAPLIERVKKEFWNAKKAVSFFIKCICFFDYFHVQTGSLDNPHTNERLVIKKPDQDCVTISRHPMEATEESVEEMHNTDWNELSEYRHIHV